MITVIPRRYDAPKWQACVAPEQVFVCQNGVRLANLFDLKQALSTLPEPVLQHHLSPERHDFSIWVASAVGDADLSRAIAKQHHRWGLIVTLERHLMRTLNLPGYVAKRWLRTSSHPFYFHSGQAAASLDELHRELIRASDAQLSDHLNRIPNDIAKWVNDEIGDYPLAEILAEANNRLQLAAVIEDHLIMLREAAAS